MPTPHPSESRSTVDLELIRCAHQPGTLRIARHSFALRYLHYIKRNPAVPRNEFEAVRKTDPEICRSCPKGRFYAKGLRS